MKLLLKAVSDQASWGFIRSQLQPLLRMRQRNLSGQPVQLVTVDMRRKAFPYFQSEPFLVPVVCHYPTTRCHEETRSVSVPTLWVLKGYCEVSAEAVSSAG